MSRVRAFTAIAVTTIMRPTADSPTAPIVKVVTGVGFLAYDPAASIARRFDLGLRVISFEEDPGVISRWVHANLPQGLHSGWNLEGQQPHLFEGQTAPLTSIHRASPGAMIDLEFEADLSLDFKSACAAHGIACDDRDPATRFDHWYASMLDRSKRGIALDAIATARLTVAVALEELRGGAGLRKAFDDDLATWLASSPWVAFEAGPVPDMRTAVSSRMPPMLSNDRDT